jgi:hypothetical protein
MSASQDPAADLSKSTDPVKQRCLDGISKIFNSDTLSGADPSAVFNSYVSDFCTL